MVCEDSDMFILQDKTRLNISNMKAIITNGNANKDIIDCVITESGVEIMFDGDDLADRFALSLNLSGISCVRDGNKVTI